MTRDTRAKLNMMSLRFNQTNITCDRCHSSRL